MTEYERGKADGIREEGERILTRIREGIASWERHQDDPGSGPVIACLEVLSTCITHRGITREQALEAALKREEDRRAGR